MSTYIKSPLNYMGGKYKLLKDILPCLPEKINNFVDLFAGGLNVGINVNANTIFVNDQITYLIDMYKFFQETDTEKLIAMIYEKIEKYQLSLVNSEGYIALREDYNNDKDILDLFVLTCYSFNHQIRFNSKHQFNTPFGKERSSYNASIELNLKRFCEALQNKPFCFSSLDFRKFDFSFLSEGDVVYCDPPYLITTGTYNDGKRGFNDWGETEERDLLALLDDLNSKGVRFVLSNVFAHKGAENEILIEWSKKYHVSYLDKRYSNCSYHFKDRETKTVEVLITNFKWEVEKCEQLMLPTQ